jgi:hypothetical protein
MKRTLHGSIRADPAPPPERSVIARIRLRADGVLRALCGFEARQLHRFLSARAGQLKIFNYEFVLSSLLLFASMSLCSSMKNTR